ncbi:MAG: SnoaL-like domain-containing protein, partial [Xanthomonadaceae bacterium]|nr:SnoaL-like domain-containing protein [Xanthomonadaceae bacterium]
WVGNWAGFTGHADMPVFGAMIDHHQAQGVITVAPDRRTAKARYRTSADRFFSRNGQGLTSAAYAAEGADHSVWYENEYLREDGVWKLHKLQVCIYAEGSVGSGYSDLPVPGRLGVPADADEDYWKPRARLAEAPPVVPYPENPKGPDRVESPSEHGCFSAKNQTMNRSVVLPFHFPNPVTGRPVIWENK